MTGLIPLGDYVLLQQEEAATKTKSGLYLPEQSAEKPKMGEVIAIGPDVSKKILRSDVVVYKPYTVTEVKLNDETYLLVKEEDLLAVVEEGTDGD